MNILDVLLRDPYGARVAACRAVAATVTFVKSLRSNPNDTGIDL